MLFKPNNAESEIINLIQDNVNSEYALIRITKTMMSKSIMDASALIREIFKFGNVVDYENIKQGPQYKIIKSGFFLSNIADKKICPVNVSYYRPETKKGDPRFWIYGLSTRRVASVDDLIYITTHEYDNKHIPVFMNLSNNSINFQLIKTFFGNDPVIEATNKLIPMVQKIASCGFIPNAKGTGKIAPKDVGETFENALNIVPNSSKLADFNDTIELKAKRSKVKSMDTLFSMVPSYNTDIVSGTNQFVRKFGYPSKRHIGFTDLFVTVNNKPNGQGLYLEVDESKEKVLQYYINGNEKTVVAYWCFSEIKQRLFQKHNSTLWILADEKKDNLTDTYEFWYNKAQLTRRPTLTAFLTLITLGKITFDWRARVKSNGKGYKDKGNAWRIKPKYRSSLFGDLKTIDLSKKDGYEV
ncbi:MvaI/BcnI family restriction endonuclease [Pediococcus pentosaceus]|uniref:MvaI/BcnI family restriction endonuclease n=1 Tax=Pediococcus pentosaceus TaxID=1255 RepID=UPI000CFFC025|nr:MvaI/BcnI family restriction endonuclease [Pediococcus pentosaceus]AVL02145.1 hypothetical protein PP40703_04725 [Pediococcus pentosaceus]MBF7134326.1 hypothetical protein [Pediococcus pentosaceus]QPT36269.1 hypothetical protein I6G30_08280 [Pediococcus pentosaceus]